jgi:putative endonuclease
MDARPATGRAGEDAAGRLYERRGYAVVSRNWRCRLGELDLILASGTTLVFCEVKTRRGAAFGGGYEAVDARKQRKLRAVADAFLQQTRASPPSVRFDVASVLLRPDGSAVVELFEDAF